MYDLTDEMKQFSRDPDPEGSKKDIGMQAFEIGDANRSLVLDNDPVFVFDEGRLRDTYRRFQTGFPGEVTYAVKANPDPLVLRHLAGAGMAAFDVASPTEMETVRRIAPQARLHYHNPIRARSEIAQARRFGVVSWSVDRISELDKLGSVVGQEIAVRLKLPVSGAAYDFGSKFGAAPAQAGALLRDVIRRGGLPSITFHPGTQCADPSAWARYIEASAALAHRVGQPLHRLNVGGGFAAARGGAAPDLERVFHTIETTAQQAFNGTPPPLVCEPGRPMVADAMDLVLRVKAVSGDALYLNDGIYGALAEWRDLGASDAIETFAPDGSPRRGAPRAWTVFGPTCDSLDRLPAPLRLPQDLAEEDILLIPGMGAYAAALVAPFNGYGAKALVAHKGDIFGSELVANTMV